MRDFAHKAAIALDLVREDRKWYENVEATAEAIRRADRDAYERGVNDGLTGKRERAVGILDESQREQAHARLRQALIAEDEYAPPVGPVAVCNEDTAQAGAQVEIETPGAFYRGRAMSGPHMDGWTEMNERVRDLICNSWEPGIRMQEELLWATSRGLFDLSAGTASERLLHYLSLPRDFSPAVPQPDGDCRFPEEAE